MELFLNLCWLSLLLPAWMLWRQRTALTDPGHRAKNPDVSCPARPLTFICALGCALVLLFPVISASDDLHAMRAEMEESSPGKRSVCHAGGERTSFWHSRWQNLPAIIASPASFALVGEWRELVTAPVPALVSPSISRSSRGPPRFRLA